MGIPTWTTGQVLTASDVNDWFVPLAAVKVSDQTIQSTTTLQNDNALTLALATNATYILEANIFWDSGTGQDYKFTWAVPSGSSLEWCYVSAATSGNTAALQAAGNVVSVTGLTVGSIHGMQHYGLLQVGPTTGSLRYQWAQNTSGAYNTSTRAGSYLALRRVG